MCADLLPGIVASERRLRIAAWECQVYGRYWQASQRDSATVPYYTYQLGLRKYDFKLPPSPPAFYFPRLLESLLVVGVGAPCH